MKDFVSRSTAGGLLAVSSWVVYAALVPAFPWTALLWASLAISASIWLATGRTAIRPRSQPIQAGRIDPLPVRRAGTGCAAAGASS